MPRLRGGSGCFMKAYHIYLLRHGQTEGNRQGQYVGRLDLPLSGEGERQLFQYARDYGYPGAEAYFTSPLSRCLRTVEILYPGVQPTVLEELKECDFGDYEGRTIEELKDDEGYRRWATGSGGAPPNGESSLHFQARCCNGFGKIVDSLLRTGRSSAVVITHGGTIGAILAAFAFPRRPFFKWLAGNGMGYEVILTPQLWMNGQVVEVAGTLPWERLREERE